MTNEEIMNDLSERRTHVGTMRFSALDAVHLRDMEAHCVALSDEEWRVFLAIEAEKRR